MAAFYQALAALLSDPLFAVRRPAGEDMALASTGMGHCKSPAAQQLSGCCLSVSWGVDRWSSTTEPLQPAFRTGRASWGRS